MKCSLKERGISLPQTVLTAVLCVFSLVTIPYVLATDGDLFSIFYCLATVPFVCLPLLLSLVFRWRLNNIFYAVFSFYALGPLLGAVYNLYYYTDWWDDLLHILAGVLFAVCGAYLARTLNRGNQTSYLLCALFGLCFSLGIAVAWELFEFGADILLGSDMQADTIVRSVATKMGRSDGGLTVYETIQEVMIDGEPLGLGGYLDIGLIDTMKDMAFETGGAVLYLVYALVDRERHPFVVSCRKERAE